MTAKLDPLIHPITRLSICGLLAAGADWVEFAALRDAAGISDSVLSKQSRVLEDAGYVEVRKGAVGRRPRTWFRLTAEGRPKIVPGMEPTPDGKRVCPSLEGASNWYSTSFNPATGLYYVQTNDKCGIFTKVPADWEAGKGFMGHPRIAAEATGRIKTSDFGLPPMLGSSIELVIEGEFAHK